ncbi:unnamed protein product [Brachionus calyciflorus]|uniref:Uncharacterized protein n=1 Tax=Brachionus calyciflorus TaxID=104777 RepID=A0A814C0P1_9BILA|nr:unnamed protein product [Brachionus calyciflorus]
MSLMDFDFSEKDQANIVQFRERYNFFVQNLNERGNELLKNRDIFSQTYQAHKAQILAHIDNNTQAKVIQLDAKFNKLSEKFETAIHEATLRKQELDAQIQIFENMVKSLESVKEKNQFQNEDFTEDDALMINDYDNELNESIRPSPKEIKVKLLDSANHIDLILNENLIMENLLNEIASGEVNVNEIVLDDVPSDQINYEIQNQTLSSLDLVDHNQFKMDTELCENFSFVKNQKCFIQFSFPSKQELRGPDDSKNLHKYLKVELLGTHQNFVPFDLKEKLTPTTHFIRIYFVPQSAGIFKLSIKYNNIEIPNSPFPFVVLANNIQTAESNSNTSLASSNFSNTSFAMDGYNVPNDETINPNLFRPPIKRIEAQANEHNTVPSFNAGRGRLLKMRNQGIPNINNNESLFPNRHVTEEPIIQNFSQKRKSPDNRSDSNNNLIIIEEMMDADETPQNNENSNKLPKLGSIDGSINRFQQPQISTLMSLNINTGPRNDIFQNRNNNTLNIISNHLRRYSNPDGLIKLLDDKQIPPLKAQFQRKFENLSFPIGVRSCNIRNWLIVCDNGTNSIKIFERTTGELLRQIQEDATNGVKFRRPSAVILNNTKSEMFVKDDKEIFVFDLEQECRLVRKFGLGILKKPYGLAYDQHENLLCVDADFRNPQIHVFNKETGALIQSRPYQPVQKLNANAHILNQRFGSQKILSNRIEPFDKSKVRFICSSQNYVYASDLGRSIIYKTDLNGNIELAFGFNGKRKGELNEPSGIFVDNDGQSILVGDSKNDRLQIYDANGRYKCEVMFCGEKIIRPSDIYVDPEGFLYVSCFIQQCVKKYKLISD